MADNLDGSIIVPKLSYKTAKWLYFICSDGETF